LKEINVEKTLVPGTAVQLADFIDVAINFITISLQFIVDRRSKNCQNGLT
jgi:hypothetical protein